MRTLIAIVFCLLVVVVHAEPKPLTTAAGLGEWVTYYYQRPEPRRLPEAILAASKLGLFQEGKAAPPFFGFIAGVVAKDPSAADSLVDLLKDLPAGSQPVVILGIWYSGHAQTGSLLTSIGKKHPDQKAMVESLTGRAPGLTEIPLEEGPWLLDALWGNFMSTGDAAPVVRIMQALPWIEVRGNTAKLIVGGAARWSLASNAEQHPRVLEICKAQLKVQPKEVAAVLQQVIGHAEEALAKHGNDKKSPSPAEKQ